MTAATSSPTADQPLPRRLVAWTVERNPPAQAPLLFVVYLVALLCGRAGTHSGRLWIGVADVLAFVAVWSFFVLLCAIDDLIDYERDKIDYPERLLQRGVVNLGHVRLIIAMALLVTLVTSLLFDGGVGPVTFAWAVFAGFQAISVGFLRRTAWLIEHFFVYRLVRGVGVGLTIVWMGQIGAREHGLPAPFVALLLPLGVLIITAFDGGRKFVSEPHQESWTRALGLAGALALVAAVLAGFALFAALVLGYSIGASAGADALLAIVAALAVAALIPGARTRAPDPRFVERVIGATLGVGLATMLVALLVARGL